MSKKGFSFSLLFKRPRTGVLPSQPPRRTQTVFISADELSQSQPNDFIFSDVVMMQQNSEIEELKKNYAEVVGKCQQLEIKMQNMELSCKTEIVEIRHKIHTIIIWVDETLQKVREEILKGNHGEALLLLERIRSNIHHYE